MSVIGIIGAMEEEVADLKAAMSEVTIRKKAGMEFYRGVLEGHPAVVGKGECRCLHADSGR